MEDPAWEQELERRIRVYEQMEAAGNWPGRLTAVDYLVMAALPVILTIAFWIWVH